MVGITYALLSAALFGVSAPSAKMLLGQVSAWLLAGLLYLGSGLGLAVARLVWRSREVGLSRRDLPWLGAAVLSGGVIGPVLLLFGLAQSSASEASLLLNLESVVTLVIAWVVFKENVDRRLMIGVVSIVAGAVVLSWPEDADLGLSWGPLLIAGACLTWAIDNNLTRKVSAAPRAPSVRGAQNRACSNLSRCAGGLSQVADKILEDRCWRGRMKASSQSGI
jgi:drug/metabolite transporter (DMT)-like permease